MNEDEDLELEPQQDYRAWCEENDVPWNLVEQTSNTPYPHGNALFEASALYWSHNVLAQQNFNEQK